MTAAIVALKCHGIRAMRLVLLHDRVLLPSERAIQYVGPVDPFEGLPVNDEGPSGGAA